VDGDRRAVRIEKQEVKYDPLKKQFTVPFKEIIIDTPKEEEAEPVASFPVNDEDAIVVDGNKKATAIKAIKFLNKFGKENGYEFKVTSEGTLNMVKVETLG